MWRALEKFVGSRRALPLAIIAVLLLIGPLVIKVVFNTNRFIQTESLVERNSRVLLELESLSLAVQEAHSLQLQYLADTGTDARQQHLQAFRTTVDVVAARTDRVAFLTHDNPEQQQQISGIRRLLAENLDAMRLAQANRSSPGYSMFTEAPHAGEIQHALQEMKEQQQLLLKAQNDNSAKYAAETKFSIYICIAAFALVVAISFFLIRQGIKEQRRSHLIASGARTELESSLLRLEKETERSMLPMSY